MHVVKTTLCLAQCIMLVNALFNVSGRCDRGRL